MRILRIINSKLYSILETISNFIILNIIWLILCLPIITIFPATSAMFAVVRQWIIHKEHRVFGPFFHHFKDNFKQSLVIGFSWTVLAALFYIDYIFAPALGSAQNILLPILFLLGFIFVFATLYLFPVMVHFQVPTLKVVTDSIVMSLLYFPLTIAMIAVLAVTTVIILVFPASILFIFSLTAYSIFFLGNIAFNKIARVSELKRKKSA